MDHIMVDVSHVDNVNVGEEAVLLASQGGKTILAAPSLPQRLITDY
jgi:alanine racemase